MQVNARIGTLLLALGAGVCGARVCGAQALADDPSVGSLLRIFTDSDRVHVRSLMGDGTVPFGTGSNLQLHVNNEQVTIPAVSAPVGSAAAVDAITTASRPIAGDAYSDYRKTRNEVEGTYVHGPATVDGYLSSERDYLARQLGAHVDRASADHMLTLSLGGSYGWDAIKPLADDDTHTGDAHKTTWHGNAVATRVLSPTTMLRAGVEYNVVDGLQHNPYRNVYAGGTHVPERHPSHRERRDAFVRLHQALPDRASLKLAYRLYDDDWGIVSHEVDTRLTQTVAPGLSARYGYRWYTQTAADFYRDEYASVDGIDGYRTHDYRLGALSSHLFGVSLEAALDAFAGARPWLRGMTLRVSYERYFNSNDYSADILETGLGFELP